MKHLFKFSKFIQQCNLKLVHIKLFRFLNNKTKRKRADIVASILIDILLGQIMNFLLHSYIQPAHSQDVFLRSTGYVCHNLERLITWLTGAPAGLKLNEPLNLVVGNFFLYHIYLWKTYIAIITPIIEFLMQMCYLVGLLGLSMQVCLIIDLLSLATFHIYCFYVYAARLYSLEYHGLIGLWRLFRGKKWNELRHRVDSTVYEFDQLVIGTFCFTILLFLMPTVLIYYVVFTFLRILVLLVEKFVSKLVNIWNSLPFFTFSLWLIGSTVLKDKPVIHIEKTDGEFQVSLTYEMPPLTAIIQKYSINTVPEDTENSICFKSILCGNVLNL